MRRLANPWVPVLTAASAVTTLALACATPFAALAAIAATRMQLREGLALMALAWAASQSIGFCVLDYPRDPTTLMWGAAMLTAALACVVAARAAAQAVPAKLSVATAFAGGFLGYKAVLLAWAFVLGGVHAAASPYWAARQFGREALILAALLALYHGAVTLGVPAAQRVRAA